MKSQRHDAMRRLGVPLIVCPTCMKSFRGDRLPRHWIHAYFDGEIVEHEDPDDLCCSGTCATERCNELNEQEERSAVKQWEAGAGRIKQIRFTYYREEQPPREADA